MSLLEELERRLNAKTIHDLRQIGRAVGVSRPAEGRKERLLDAILKIASGESDPAMPAVRGAHPKSAEYDRQLVSDILRCREISLFSNETKPETKVELSVASGALFDPLDFKTEGLLEKADGKWFVRGASKIFVNEFFVNKYNLREGDFVCCKCRRNSTEEDAGLASIISINGLSPELSANRTEFEKLTPVYPNKRLRVCRGANDVLGTVTDLLAPVGAGSRGLVVAPHGAGKTTVLKEIAQGIKLNNPEVKLIIALIDARPEEASDFIREFKDVAVFTSLFDAGAQGHINTAKLALEYAKRQTELSKDAVLILDDVTKLTRAYNYCGLQVSGTLDTNALVSAKKYLAAARNAEEGGSLTIITAVSTGGDIVDENIYSGLKDVCNMRITLSLKLARMRIFPPVEVAETFTLGDEKLLTPNDFKQAAKLRSGSIEDIIKEQNQ